MVLVKDKFGFVPCSVLYFGKTKQLTMGFGEQTHRQNADGGSMAGGKMSEFNPDLCKFIIEMWSLPGDKILDCFMGWGTRPVIALQLGRNYVGYDISPIAVNYVKKVLANNAATRLSNLSCKVEAVCGDGTKVEGIEQNSIDFVFSCPPYFNIEKYESVPGQLTDIDNYEQFLHLYQKCISRLFNVLKPGKFAVFVVGDWREEGRIKLFSFDTIKCFEAAGFVLHDFIIHKLDSMTVLGVGNAIERGCVPKAHEFVLVFKKPEGSLVNDSFVLEHGITETEVQTLIVKSNGLLTKVGAYKILLQRLKK